VEIEKRQIVLQVAHMKTHFVFSLLATFLCIGVFAQTNSPTPLGDALLRLANATPDEVKGLLGSPNEQDVSSAKYKSPDKRISDIDIDFTNVSGTKRSVSVQFTLITPIDKADEIAIIIEIPAKRIGPFRMVQPATKKHIADLSEIPAPPAELDGVAPYSKQWVLILQDFNKDGKLEHTFIKRQVEPGQ
jgi:hypothetical protein